MALAEAFAHGVPLVTTGAGAAGAWIGRRGARIVRTTAASPRCARRLRQVIGTTSAPRRPAPGRCVAQAHNAQLGGNGCRGRRPVEATR